MEYLHVSEELKSSVRKIFGVSEEEIKKDVDILQEWYKKQRHLPEIEHERIYFEHGLLWNKFRMEKTKHKIECLFTVRNLLGYDFMEGVCNITPINEPTVVFPLPRLNPVTKERIMFWAVKNSDQSEYCYEKDIQQWFLCLHYLFRHDYCSGIRFLVDLENTTAQHLGKTNPVLLLKFINVYMNNINHRFVGCDYINASGFHATLISLTKSILPEKLAKRVFVHKNVASLQKNIPLECLPKEFGGLLETKQNMIEKWNSEIIQNREEFTRFLTLKIDETFRPPQVYSLNDNFGVDGTFKKLNID